MNQDIENYLSWLSTFRDKAHKAYRPHLFEFCDIAKKCREKDYVRYASFVRSNYSPRYAAYKLTVVRGFIKKMHRWGKTDMFPEDVRIPKFIAKQRVYSVKSDVERMIATLDASSYSDLRKIVAILFLSRGLRVSEVCDLNLSDLDIQKRTALIETKKGYKTRWVKWNRKMQETLVKFVGIRICINSGNALFVSSEGSRIVTRTLERWVREACIKAGILKKITPHSVRHGFAHHIFHQGANVKEIALLLGHSETNPKAAFEYIRLDEKEFMKVAGKYL